ncbi:MAG TPA: AMP-binding protein, partial [Burkholderiaceae bacterium]|nr:AMP-binding protein [Burkholderiaceae bacterium]
MSINLAQPHHAIWPTRLPRELVLPETSLWFNTEVAAKRYPNKAAYLFCGRALTFSELHRQALALAGWLQAKGVRRGDRVIVFMQNCPQFPVAVQAILRADAVVVPVNPMNKADEFGHYISDSGARIAITTADLAGIVAQADAQLSPSQRLRELLVTHFTDAMPDVLDPAEEPSLAVLQWLRARPELPPRCTPWRHALAAGHAPSDHASGPDDMAVLPYTSGTTGLPKGCIHTHRTIMHNVVGGGQWGHSFAETVTLGVVPMFHITGFVYYALGPMASGATAVLMPRWDRELAARLIARYKVSHWTCIPTMIIDLFASPNVASFNLKSLRFVSGGGAAMPQA